MRQGENRFGALNEEARREISKRQEELGPKVGKMDREIAEGKIPSLEEFQQLCRDRAQGIRDGVALKPDYLAEALIREAERLERAANGDIDELVSESLRHADFYQWLSEDSEKQDEDRTAAESWSKLAETIEARKKD